MVSSKLLFYIDSWAKITRAINYFLLFCVRLILVTSDTILRNKTPARDHN